VARISPTLDSIRYDAGYFREIDVLEKLQDTLPDGYEIFHSVAMHTLSGNAEHHGEIDLIVLGPSGAILLLEVKAGDVTLRDGGIFKAYRNQERDIVRQTQTQYAAMRNRLTAARLDAYVTNCLVLPDYRVDNDAHIVSIPRERIIDAEDFNALGACVQGILERRYAKSDMAEIRRFLANEFQISADLKRLGAQLRNTCRRLAEGLATWVPRIETPSGIIRVQASAGAGKTQLALRLLNDAAAKQDKALYVCFNRSLADHMRQLIPAACRVASFHELCVKHYSVQHGNPDFSQPNIYQILEQHYRDASANFAPQYALIVIDEGQDFEPAWVASLLPLLQENSKLYLLEDDNQRLYQRDAFDLTDAVTVSCHDNFRSPKAICNTINALGLTDTPTEARNPYEGELPGFHIYLDSDSLIHETAEAIRALVKRGIPLDEIAVLSSHGLSKSKLMSLDRIEDITTRRFTGQFDKNGTPVWTQGAVLVDSIYRFKGQSASGIVLAELDFTELNESVRRKLLVGMTRAEIGLELIVAQAAEHCISAILRKDIY
jgi:Holliday junction resolvase-like predicted endonuclease